MIFRIVKAMFTTYISYLLSLIVGEPLIVQHKQSLFPALHQPTLLNQKALFVYCVLLLFHLRGGWRGGGGGGEEGRGGGGGGRGGGGGEEEGRRRRGGGGGGGRRRREEERGGGGEEEGGGGGEKGRRRRGKGEEGRRLSNCTSHMYGKSKLPDQKLIHQCYAM